MRERAAGIFGRTKDSILRFTENPIGNLGFLMPMAICLTSIISGIVTYIMFIVNGGYSKQVGLIKRNGFDGVSDAFTDGTVGLMTSGIAAKILLAFVGIEFIVMLISYFIHRGKGMRIAMIVDLAVITILAVLSMTVFRIAVRKLIFSNEQINQFLTKYEGMTINAKEILITYAVVSLVSLICFIVFILITKECRWMVGYTALALAFSNIVMPLFFKILQNIIPIGGKILAVVIIFAVIKVIIIVSSDHPEDINWKKEELQRAKEKSSEYKARADANFKEARDGLNLIISAETKREWARNDLKKAESADKEIQWLEEDIRRLESKFGKQGERR